MIKHLHFLFASILMLAFGMNASAQDVVTFNFTEANSYEQFGLEGFTNSSTQNNGGLGDILNDATSTQGNTTFTVTPSNGNPNRMWDSNGQYTLRVYGGKVIIASDKNLTKIEFDFGKMGKMSASTGTYEGKIWTPTDATNKVEFEITSKCFFKNVTITLGEGGGSVDPTPDPTPGEASEIYSVVFNTNEAVNSWTVEGYHVNDPEFKTLHAKGFMQLYSYMAQEKELQTSYVVSPVITLGSDNVASFTHANIEGQDLPIEELTAFAVRTVGGEWTEIEIPNRSTDWKNLVNSGDLKIPASFNGKEVQFGFKYLWDGGNNTCFWFIQDFKVMGTVEGTEPEPTETIAENIAAFRDLCVKDGVDVTLKLVDAQVLYVNEYEAKGKTTQNVYVRDATGSLMFYNAGLTVKAGDIMNGSVKGIAKDHYDTKEFCKNADTDFSTVTITEGEAVAVEKTIAEITMTEISNLVIVKDVKMIVKEETDSKGKVHTNYYLVDAEGNELAYYNKFKIEGLNAEDFVEKENHNFVGVITINFGKIQLCPTEAAVPTGIDCIENVELDVNAPMYNVAGQKVNANFKGIVLQNGKKFFNK